MIRDAGPADFDAMLQIVNDAAQAYRGHIPADCWREPYMDAAELAGQIADGVRFACYVEDGAPQGMMGLQDRGPVYLIRHAYVRTALRQRGIGGQLLRNLTAGVGKPVLIGTWAAAAWAIAFYQKHGFRLVPPTDKDRLLRTYWRIPPRQTETSVVLANAPADAIP